MNTDIYFIHAITPLHAGVGQGVGAVDLPIARERATNLPYLPGSSLKGALRGLSTDADVTKKLFGPDTHNASEHAGSVQFSDARLLFFPVRSFRGVFAYVTSPLLLSRFMRDANYAKAGDELKLPIEGPCEDAQCLVGAGSRIVHPGPEPRVWLEDLGLKPQTMDGSVFRTLGQRIDIADLDERICILSDDAMSFLVDTATEITARIRLDNDKLTVARGGLWYEEALPAETVLAGIVHTRANGHIDASNALDGLHALTEAHGAMQLGGKTTIGRGVCRFTFARGNR